MYCGCQTYFWRIVNEKISLQTDNTHSRNRSLTLGNITSTWTICLCWVMFLTHIPEFYTWVGCEALNTVAENSQAASSRWPSAGLILVHSRVNVLAVVGLSLGDFWMPEEDAGALISVIPSLWITWCMHAALTASLPVLVSSADRLGEQGDSRVFFFKVEVL